MNAVKEETNKKITKLTLRYMHSSDILLKNCSLNNELNNCKIIIFREDITLKLVKTSVDVNLIPLDSDKTEQLVKFNY